MSSAYLAVAAGLPFQVFEIKRGVSIAGRSPDVDLILNHLEVSRRHSQIVWDGTACHVEDLKSQWGTKIDGVRIPGWTELRPGAKLSIGPVSLLFAVGQPPSEGDVKSLAPALGENDSPLTVVVAGRKVERISLSDGLVLGRGDDAGVVLQAPSVSRQHAQIQQNAGGFRVIDLRSSAGSFVNGHRFDEHDLTIGDRLQIGPFFFQFDGSHFNVVSDVSGGTIEARDVCSRSPRVVMLDLVSFRVPACRFAGIIGPSGAGKSSLLGALSGLRKPDSGSVLVDGLDVYASGEVRSAFGFVPQEDIVHPELTVSDALLFAAQLRLPGGTPRFELQKLIIQTMKQLGLRDFADAPVAKLSGGQRKRVSVGVELLAKPPILFLDEPSSGLDPATEFKLMELLRALADTGCTIVCTTHVMENVYLMDQLVVMFGGRLVFSGSPQETRDHFGVQRLTALYEKLEENPPAAWIDESMQASAASATRSKIENRGSKIHALPVLLRRQFAILCSDAKNFAILLGEPLVIAALVAWATDDASLALFFAYVATLWFGCSNAAQEIVKEIPIYRRERIVGVGRHAYLAGKFIFLGAITALQAAIVYLALQIFERGLDGSIAWQSLGLAGIALASVGIGAAISALARTVMQAVLIVPIILIPLILFSGHPVPVNEMKPAVLAVSELMPTFASQTMMDASFLWRKKIEHESLSQHWTSFRNLNRDKDLKTGDVFARTQPGVFALLTHLVWAVVTYAIAFVALRSRERG